MWHKKLVAGVLSVWALLEALNKINVMTDLDKLGKKYHKD
jgi:hypothetical protein